MSHWDNSARGNEPNNGAPGNGTPNGSNPDRAVLTGKCLVFCASALYGAVPAALGFSMGVIHWDFYFLTLFASMLLGVGLYFTLGSHFLRVLIDGYAERLRLGEPGHASEVLIIALICNFGLHIATLLAYGVYTWSIVLVSLSALFFTYPIYYLVNVLWNSQLEVRHITTGKTALNTRFYANTPRRATGTEHYLPVTISLPVYTESNEVIFKTISSCLEAIDNFRQKTGLPANLLVSDDGLAKLLGDICTTRGLTSCGDQAAERIAFYRAHNIAFVARPLRGRRGKFKKGSNLNYTYAIAHSLQGGASLTRLFGPGGAFTGGYAEGEIVLHDLILMLDKDSGLAPDILTTTVPEFTADPSLAYTQHATRSANENMNYFTRSMSRFTDVLYRISLPGKALQGLQIPLMGHNAFLRRSFLEATGGWAENRVSEDYAKAQDAYLGGWHGKFIAYPGMDFSEYVCQNFVEETEKQSRYSYGISEVVFARAWDCLRLAFDRVRGKGPSCLIAHSHGLPAHTGDMMVYYLSYFNLGAAMPMTLLLLYTHQIYYLFAGILINIVIFWLVPSLHALLLGRASGFKGVRGADAFAQYAIIGIAFLGHAYSMMKGFLVYLSDKLKDSYEPFTATNVNEMERSFRQGARILGKYYRQNLLGLAITVCVVLGCLTVLQDIPPHIIRPFIVLFLMCYVLAPVIFTPQLYGLASTRRKTSREQTAQGIPPQGVLWDGYPIR
jgi:cellulose synthase/poly-beta-1,6-N-acetylglucosamine synthase-like glycosyltransferase